MAEETKTEVQVDEKAELLKELERIGVESTEQLQNMKTASSQVGQMANMVGDLRAEITELKSQRTEPTYQDDGTADIARLIEEGVDKAIEKRTQAQMQAQRAAQQAALRDIQSVQGDQDFPLVQSVWEEHLNSPVVRANLQTGQTTISNEYHKLVRGYYRKIAERSRDVIGSMGEKATPPHVESAETNVATPQFSESDEKSEKIKNAQKTWTGSDRDIDSLLDAVLPPGDLSRMR